MSSADAACVVALVTGTELVAATIEDGVRAATERGSELEHELAVERIIDRAVRIGDRVLISYSHRRAIPLVLHG